MHLHAQRTVVPLNWLGAILNVYVACNLELDSCHMTPLPVIDSQNVDSQGHTKYLCVRLIRWTWSGFYTHHLVLHFKSISESDNFSYVRWTNFLVKISCFVAQMTRKCAETFVLFGTSHGWLACTYGRRLYLSSAKLRYPIVSVIRFGFILSHDWC